MEWCKWGRYDLVNYVCNAKVHLKVINILFPNKFCHSNNMHVNMYYAKQQQPWNRKFDETLLELTLNGSRHHAVMLSAWKNSVFGKMLESWCQLCVKCCQRLPWSPAFSALFTRHRTTALHEITTKPNWRQQTQILAVIIWKSINLLLSRDRVDFMAINVFINTEYAIILIKVKQELWLTWLDDDGVEETHATDHSDEVLRDLVELLTQEHPQTLRVLSQSLLLTHLQITHLQITHLQVTHLQVTHLQVTHLQVTHLQVTHLQITHLHITQLQITHLQITHLQITHLQATHLHITLTDHTLTGHTSTGHTPTYHTSRSHTYRSHTYNSHTYRSHTYRSHTYRPHIYR